MISHAGRCVPKRGARTGPAGVTPAPSVLIGSVVALGGSGRSAHPSFVSPSEVFVSFKSETKACPESCRRESRSFPIFFSSPSVILSEVEGSPRSDLSGSVCRKKIETRKILRGGLGGEAKKKIGTLFDRVREAFASIGRRKGTEKRIASPFENTQGRLRSYNSSSFRSG